MQRLIGPGSAAGYEVSAITVTSDNSNRVSDAFDVTVAAPELEETDTPGVAAQDDP